MKRIFTFDLMRAVAIIGVVVVHALLHNWASSDAVEAGSEEPSVMVLVIFYFLTMAGLFYIVMGAVNSYMIHNRLESGRNKMKQMVGSGMVLGVFLVGSHYIFRALLSADSGILYFLVREGKYITPAPEWIIGTCTLAMLGYTLIFVPLILALLFRNGGIKESNRNYWILFILGTFFLVSAPIIRDSLAREVVTMIDQGNYVPAAILGAFVYDLFPIFPYLGYGIYGAILGIALARQENPRVIKRYLLIGGTIWLAVGFAGNFVYGGPDPSLYREFSPQAIFNKTFLQYSQVGLLMILTFFGLKLFDFVPEDVQKRRTRFLKFIRRFSLISLTIFLFEGIVMAVIATSLDAIPLIDGWDVNISTVAIVSLANILLWALIAYLWEKVNYVGSVEWSVLKISEWFSGKKSDKFIVERRKKIRKVREALNEEPKFLLEKRAEKRGKD